MSELRSVAVDISGCNFLSMMALKTQSTVKQIKQSH